jgi:N-acetylglucosamine-6-phosphate deacetylase
MSNSVGYWDLQVNGYLGVDFNGDHLDVDHLEQVCEHLLNENVVGILATVITARIDAMCGRLQRIVSACAARPRIAQLIQGIHIEGPFLNPAPGFIGAHPVDCARPATIEAMEELLDAAGGMTRIVTLAPECDEELATTHMLAKQGITVSAGHCDPSWEQLHAAIEAGLSMFTHLGNGCPLQLHRHDNVIQRALSLSERLWIGLIADGVHLPMMTFKNILRCATLDHCFVVSDAIAAAGMGPGRYQLGEREVLVDEHLATWAADRSHLVGSAITLKRAAENLRQYLGLVDHEVEQLLAINPRRAIGIGV